jgi:hypothetical protein
MALSFSTFMACIFFLMASMLLLLLLLLLLASVQPLLESWTEIGKARVSTPQSRQSAKLFLQSSDLGLPHPLARRRVCAPPLWFRWGGGAHSLAGEWRGWESPNSNGGTYTVVFYIYIQYMYFVLYTFKDRKRIYHCKSNIKKLYFFF